MKSIVISFNGLPVYTAAGLPKNYHGELLHLSVEGAEGEYGLIVLQEKTTQGIRGRLNFFQTIKNLFIRHDFMPETYLQAFFSMGADILYRIEGHGSVTLKRGEYIIVPAPAKKIEAELQSGNVYKIFQAVFTNEAIKAMNDLFPEIREMLYDEYGRWVPEAKQAGERLEEVVHTIMSMQIDDKIAEKKYLSDQYSRLFYVMIMQSNAVYRSKLYTDKEAVLRIEEQLLRSINNPPKMAVIAQRLRMTVNRAMTLFKQVTGMRPPQFVSKKKMEIAYLEVTTTNKPLKTIAAELGFKKQQSFSTKFKEWYGKTPKELRKEIYNSED